VHRLTGGNRSGRGPIFSRHPVLRNRFIGIAICHHAGGSRNLSSQTLSHHDLEAIPGLHYKVDSNHDIVYMEFESPSFTITELKAIFTKLGLHAKIVGTIPAELNPKKTKTQPIRLPS